MSQNNHRRISIVLPNFNGERYLEASIHSFLRQNYTHKKLFIVDGKSKDNSWRILEKFSNRPEIEWLNIEDHNVPHAVNQANARLSDQDIWGFLGCDDILLPGVFEKVGALFEAAPNLGGVYFDSYTVRRNPNSCALRKCPDVPFTPASLARYGTIVGLQNIYLDCGLVKKFGINEKRKYASDYELYFHLAKLKDYNFVYYPMPSTMNIADVNITTVNAAASIRDAVHVATQHYGLTFKLMARYLRTYLPGYGK